MSDVSESLSSEDSEENILPDFKSIQPYMFEPKRELNSSDSSLSTSSESTEGESSEEERVNLSWWCQCACCGPMPSTEECVCCQEMTSLEHKMEGLSCITEHLSFDVVCLHADVLRTALVAMHDVGKETLEDVITNRTFRLAAYRQFTWWMHQRLGKGVRRVIPSCVVNRVREEFPDEDGQYVGFKDAEGENAWPG